MSEYVTKPIPAQSLMWLTYQGPGAPLNNMHPMKIVQLV